MKCLCFEHFSSFVGENLRKVKFLLGIEQDSWMIGPELDQ